MANVHSPVFEPLSKDPLALDSALAAAVGGCAAIALAPVPARAPVHDHFLAACHEAGRIVHLERRDTSPITDTAGDFAGYREPRKRSWREIERRRRRLHREHSPTVRLIERPEGLEAELVRGFELEASGWKGINRTAILSTEETRRFYTSVALAFRASGELVLSSIEVEGRMLAWDLALLEGGRYWLLKTAYDERYRSLAPGLVLRHQVIEHCFQRGLRAHEFLGGAMDWKLPFATAQREHVALFAYPKRPVGLLGYSYRRFARPPAARVYHLLRPPRRHKDKRPSAFAEPRE